MILSDISTRVKRSFGDEAGVQLTENDVIRWVNDGQIDVVRRTECLVRVSPVDAVAGTSQYPLPTDFLFFKRGTVNGRLLSSINFGALDQLYPHRDESYPRGTPEYFSVRGQNFVLYPAPDTTKTGAISIEYVARPAVITTDTQSPEIPIQFHEALVLFCLMRAKELDESWDAAVLFRRQYDEQIVGIRHEGNTDSANAYPVIRDDYGDNY